VRTLEIEDVLDSVRKNGCLLMALNSAQYEHVMRYLATLAVTTRFEEFIAHQKSNKERQTHPYDEEFVMAYLK